MKTLKQISDEQSGLYVEKAMRANRENKILRADENGNLILEDLKKTKEELSSEIRHKRDYLLNESDKFVSVPDYPIDVSKRQKWLEYRQELRDITLQTTFPDKVVWPVMP